MTKPLCKVSDIVFIRFELTDIKRQKEYLQHFGMQLASETADTIYYRGTGSAPYCYIASRGDEDRFISAAYRVNSLDELKNLAEQSGSDIQQSTEPAGGQFVRVQDPDGFAVEVYFGMQGVDAALPPLPRLNSGSKKTRINDLQRIGKASDEWVVQDGEWLYELTSSVMRLGHTAINVSNADRSIAWYQKTLGMLISDNLMGPDNETRIGVFMRCDLGDKPVDHHTINIVELPGAGEFASTFGHAGFELSGSVDDLMAGHFHMKTLGRYVHEWGVGRHLLGSQIYDYWRDPQGFILEHWTDGDLLDASVPPTDVPAKDFVLAQYGPLAPSTFNLTMPSEEVEGFRKVTPALPELMK